MDKSRVRIRETTRVKKWDSVPPDDPRGPDETVETNRWFDENYNEITDPVEIERLNRKLEES